MIYGEIRLAIEHKKLLEEQKAKTDAIKPPKALQYTHMLNNIYYEKFR